MWFNKGPKEPQLFTYLSNKLDTIMDTLDEQNDAIQAQKAQIKSLEDELSSMSLWAGQNDYEYTEPDK